MYINIPLTVLSLKVMKAANTMKKAIVGKTLQWCYQMIIPNITILYNTLINLQNLLMTFLAIWNIVWIIWNKCLCYMNWINKTFLQNKCDPVHRKVQCFQHIQSNIPRVLPLIFIHTCGHIRGSGGSLSLNSECSWTWRVLVNIRKVQERKI